MAGRRLPDGPLHAASQRLHELERDRSRIRLDAGRGRRVGRDGPPGIWRVHQDWWRCRWDPLRLADVLKVEVCGFEDHESEAWWPLDITDRKLLPTRKPNRLGVRIGRRRFYSDQFPTEKGDAFGLGHCGRAVGTFSVSLNQFKPVDPRLPPSPQGRGRGPGALRIVRAALTSASSQRPQSVL